MRVVLPKRGCTDTAVSLPAMSANKTDGPGQYGFTACLRLKDAFDDARKASARADTRPGAWIFSVEGVNVVGFEKLAQ